MDDFNALMRDITDRQLALMGLPPLKTNTELRANSASNSDAPSCVTDNSALAPFQYPEVGSPLMLRLLKPLPRHDWEDRQRYYRSHRKPSDQWNVDDRHRADFDDLEP